MVDGIKSSRKVKESETCDLFERYGVDDMIVNGKEGSLSGMVFCVG
jgi:hypothetical protein